MICGICILGRIAAWIWLGLYAVVLGGVLCFTSWFRSWVLCWVELVFRFFLLFCIWLCAFVNLGDTFGLLSAWSWEDCVLEGSLIVCSLICENVADC